MNKVSKEERYMSGAEWVGRKATVLILLLCEGNSKYDACLHVRQLGTQTGSWVVNGVLVGT